MGDAMDVDVLNLQSLQCPLPSPLRWSPYTLPELPGLPIGTEWCSLDALWPDGEEPDAEEHAGRKWKRKTQRAERRLMKKNERIDQEVALALDELGEGIDDDEPLHINSYIDPAAEDATESLENEENGYASAFQAVPLPMNTHKSAIKKRPAKAVAAYNPYDQIRVKKRKVTFQTPPPAFGENGERLLPEFSMLMEPLLPIRPNPHSLSVNPGLKNAFVEMQQAQQRTQKPKQQHGCSKAFFDQLLNTPEHEKLSFGQTKITAFDVMKKAACTEKKWNPTQVTKQRAQEQKQQLMAQQKVALAQTANETKAREIQEAGVYHDEKTGAVKSWYTHPLFLQ